MQDDLHFIADAKYWTSWMSTHELRRGLPFVTDHLVGIAVLDIDDDRCIEDLQAHAYDNGLDDLLETVELVIVEGLNDGSARQTNMVDVDLDQVPSHHRIHSPKSFKQRCNRIRASKDKRAAASAILR